MRVTRFLHSISRVMGRVVLFSIAIGLCRGGRDSPGSQDYGTESDGRSQQFSSGPWRSVLQALTAADLIYLVSNTFDNADKFLHSVQAWLAVHYPTVKTIYVEKKGDYVLDDPDLWKEIKANNGLMVMAIGH